MNNDSPCDSTARVRSAFEQVLLERNPPAAARRWRMSRFDRGLRLADEYEARFGSLAGKRVLDVGAAHGGDVAAMYARGAAVVGADMYDHNYTRLRRRVAGNDNRLSFVRFDCSKPWPLETDSFDLVYSMGVLELVMDLPCFFSEMARVLAPGGVAMLFTGTALRMARCDPLFKLPLISLLPTPLRCWTAAHLFGRRYALPVAPHTFYSAADIQRFARPHGYQVVPEKYARSQAIARLGRWPMGRLWQRIMRFLAFDFVLVVPRSASTTVGARASHIRGATVKERNRPRCVPVQ